MHLIVHFIFTEKGTNVLKVSRIDIKTTMEIYTYTTEQSKKEAAQQLSLIHSDLLDQLL